MHGNDRRTFEASSSAYATAHNAYTSARASTATGHPQIGDHDGERTVGPAGQQQAARCDITMHEVVAVQHLETAGRLGAQPQGLRRRDPGAAQILQRTGIQVVP